MNVLLIDDDAEFCKIMKLDIEKLGFSVTEVHEPPDNIQKCLQDTKPGIILLDVFLPDRNRLDILDDIKKADNQIPVIVITAKGKIDIAVDAMKRGADDFIEKPINLVRFNTILKRMGEISKLRREAEAYQSFRNCRDGCYGMIGSSAIMKELYQSIHNVADSNANVMITGETGSGKELVARAIHKLSLRKGPLVEIDCGSIPGELMESELFGHEKGAFTGAHGSSSGRIELSIGGTLFFDEICELDMKLQVKLLRFLQERYIRRIGGKKHIPVETRIISATNKNPDQEVAAGRFRDDLLYRLKVVPITVPPLRARREDIPLLAHKFVEVFAQENNKDPMDVEADVYELLKRYHWPGNVRELKNVIQRIVVVNNGNRITGDMIPENIQQNNAAAFQSSLGGHSSGENILLMDEVKNMAFEKALRVCRGDVYMAADKLGISANTLYRFMKKHGITAEEFQ